MDQVQLLPYSPGDPVCCTDPGDCFTYIGVIAGGPVSNGRALRAWPVVFDEGHSHLVPEHFMSRAPRRHPAPIRLVTLDGARVAP